MRFETLLSAFSRTLFVVALLVFVMALVEKVANMNGQTLAFMDYSPGRLLEFAAILLLFVVTVTLRRIRKELSNRRD